METKREIRKHIFALRKACTDAEVEEKSRIITQRIIQTEEFKNADRILAYADYNHEVMTCYVIEEAWKAGKTVAVPRVSGKDMQFYILHDFSQLSPGYFNIPEPAEGEPADWEEALMIMPGVAFDQRCNRVGYGGGFYDRYLEKHPGVTRLAAAFEFQVLETVPTESTDIRPHMVVTEAGIRRI